MMEMDSHFHACALKRFGARAREWQPKALNPIVGQIPNLDKSGMGNHYLRFSFFEKA